MPPSYRLPPRLLIAATFDLLRGARRSFRSDAQTSAEAVRPPIRCLGQEHIPSRPCLITINHYSRPGFPAWWLALGVSAFIPAEVRWLITSAWTFPGRAWAGLGERASRVVLRRLAHMYAFSQMPPMPPRPHELLARAGAVRQLLGSLRLGETGWLGIAPEGRDAPGGRLQLPPSGSGRFLLLLAGLGLPLLPAGIYEAQGVCTIRFGESYHLAVQPGLAPDQRDKRASQIVMQRLAALLPARLRGPFDPAIPAGAPGERNPSGGVN